MDKRTLNEAVKRHITRLSELHTRGESVYQIFHAYVRDAAQAGLINLGDEQEIYETFHPEFSNNEYTQSVMTRVEVRKVKHSIEDGIDANHKEGE